MRLRCEVCDAPATVLVTVEWSNAVTVGPACDQCAADLDEYAENVEVLPW